MRPPVPRAPASFLTFALTLLASSLLVAPPVSASTLLGLDFDPPTATWQDDVVAHLKIRSDCYVSEESQVTLTYDAFGPVIQIEPDYGCVYDPPLLQDWNTVAHVGHLAPGTYTVKVVGVTPESQGSYESYTPATLELNVPEPVTDAAPFDLDVAGYESCAPSTTAVDVTPPYVDVRLDSDCVTSTLDRELFHHPVEIGPLAAGDWQVRVFNQFNAAFLELATAPLRVYDATGCVPSATVLCLHHGRFEVEATWEGFGGGSGEAQAIPLAGLDGDRDDTGLFWFFNPTNVELTVKVLDGCGVNGRYWVFLSPGSTVRWQLTVTDTATRESRLYDNDLGETPELVADTAAFDACP